MGGKEGSGPTESVGAGGKYNSQNTSLGHFFHWGMENASVLYQEVKFKVREAEHLGQIEVTLSVPQCDRCVLEPVGESAVGRLGFLLLGGSPVWGSGLRRDAPADVTALSVLGA